MIPVCGPTRPQAKLGQKLVPSHLAVVSKIPKAAHMVSVFYGGSYHKQPRRGDYDSKATVPPGLEARKLPWGRGGTDRRFHSGKAMFLATYYLYIQYPKERGIGGASPPHKDTILIYL